MKPIVIPVYCNNEYTAQKEELSLGDVLFSEYDIRPCTFYHIAAVGSYLETVDGKDIFHAVIESNGMTFHSPLTYQEVNEIVQGRMITPALQAKIREIESSYAEEFKQYRP